MTPVAEAAYPDALPALSRLHWYVVERVLGQGGFGITYLARDTNLDQPVAIKEYLPIDVATRMGDATIRSRSEELRDRYRWGLERFIQEARTLARFDHPNIVRVQSVFEFNNTAYMVMRFEKGMTLSALLDRRGTLPERELLRILLPILDGLELIHNAGFIHRDVKPDNIHIGEDGNPVLLDFGSARQALGASHTLTILVAPGYAPFEQYYSDSTSQGPWTDIYGLGATCYRAIAGRPPLDAVSRSKGILGSTQEIMVPASVIGAGRYSGSLLTAIDHALAFAEKDRPQSIAEWRRELVAGHTQPPEVTDLRVAPIVTARAENASSTQLRASTVSAPSVPPTVNRESKSSPLPLTPTQPREASDETRPRKPVTIIIVLGAAVLAVGVGAYIATTQRSDETSAKVAALEKQLRDREQAAEAERLAKQKSDQQRADEERKAKEQAAAEEKSQADARKRAEEQARVDEQKRRESASKQPPKDTSKANVSTGVPPSKAPPPPTKSTPVTGEAVASLPPATSQPSPSSSEPPKPTSPPQVPSDLLANADRAMASRDYAEALAILKPLADAGNAQAQARLGDMYTEGRGVGQSQTEAVKWYERAALQGDVALQLKLARMYANGTGVDRNPNLAYVWYGIASRLGNATAKSEQERVGTALQPAEREQLDRQIESRVRPMQKKT